MCRRQKQRQQQTTAMRNVAINDIRRLQQPLKRDKNSSSSSSLNNNNNSNCNKWHKLHNPHKAATTLKTNCKWSKKEPSSASRLLHNNNNSSIMSNETMPTTTTWLKLDYNNNKYSKDNNNHNNNITCWRSSPTVEKWIWSSQRGTKEKE